MIATDEQIGAMCMAFSDRLWPVGWSEASEAHRMGVRKAMLEAVAALPEPQPGPMPDRLEVAKALLAADWHPHPGASFDQLGKGDQATLLRQADRAIDLCAGRLPAGVWAVLQEMRACDSDGVELFAVTAYADKLEAALKALPPQLITLEDGTTPEATLSDEQRAKTRGLRARRAEPVSRTDELPGAPASGAAARALVSELLDYETTHASHNDRYVQGCARGAGTAGRKLDAAMRADGFASHEPAPSGAGWPDSLLDGTRGRAEVFREALIAEREHCDAWRDATGCKTPDEAEALRKSLACSRDRMRVTAERLEAADRHIESLDSDYASERDRRVKAERERDEGQTQLAEWRVATGWELPSQAKHMRAVLSARPEAVAIDEALVESFAARFSVGKEYAREWLPKLLGAHASASAPQGGSAGGVIVRDIQRAIDVLTLAGIPTHRPDGCFMKLHKRVQALAEERDQLRTEIAQERATVAATHAILDVNDVPHEPGALLEKRVEALLDERDEARAELEKTRGAWHVKNDMLKSCDAGDAELRAELEKTRAELEACTDKLRAANANGILQSERYEALRAACTSGVEERDLFERLEPIGEYAEAAKSYWERVQAALRPAPSEAVYELVDVTYDDLPDNEPATPEGNSPGIPDGSSAAPDAGADGKHDWQLTSSGHGSHSFRCSRCDGRCTMDGFASLDEARDGLNPHECVPKVEPLSLAERNEITVGDSIGLRKPRLAHDIPPPRALSPEEMAEATEEAREFRDNLGKVTAGIEGAPPAERPASLQEAWAAIEALQRDNTVLWAYVESVASEPWTEHTWRDGKPVSWSEWLAFKALDARKGGA